MDTKGQMYANPDDMRDFAEKLNLFADQVDYTDTHIRERLKRLGESFRDDQYEKLWYVFEKSRQKLDKAVALSREAAVRLKRDAEILEHDAQQFKNDLNA
jgi:hypothetical protein